MSHDLEELERHRRRVEERLAAVRASLIRETGFAPSRKYLLLALVAVAGGLALGFSLKGRRRRHLPKGAEHRLPRTGAES
jgi:hypothetical protein